ncbi:uncharacterized protein M421DRAFT_416355 [Didymella exigua CBS 183.55]|uniref:Uncharacterized protein n=1 Tax=Didymella exigua CBS 183.55 TaxID=1150837 RepID=A0A6A5RZH7_9PLEO|nr:uncharacterized protein M421DRAFT_416355 [Didymella exigua CBS 183.55]KAF1932740.1 hypothetical protein M421DRAFT_416355 [Didymella exigua CBS 183.55]
MARAPMNFAKTHARRPDVSEQLLSLENLYSSCFSNYWQLTKARFEGCMYSHPLWCLAASHHSVWSRARKSLPCLTMLGGGCRHAGPSRLAMTREVRAECGVPTTRSDQNLIR